MAHVTKIKATAVAPMLDHYERVAERERGYRRDNIDPERMADNINLRPHDVRDEVRAAISQHVVTAGKALRKDANVLLDWVVTLPADCPRERMGEFFEAVTQFIEYRYGKERVLGAYVHLDETTPHVHVPVLPLVDGKLQASKLVNRLDLQTFHPKLSEWVEDALGMRVSIELGKDQAAAKALSAVPHEKLAEATRELDERIAERTARLEYLQREIERLESEEPPGHSLSKSVGDVRAGLEGRRREQEASSENQRLRERVGELERKRSEVVSRIGGLRANVEQLRADVASVKERLVTLVRSLSNWGRSLLRVAAPSKDDVEAVVQTLRDLGVEKAEVFDSPMAMARNSAARSATIGRRATRSATKGRSV